jgi:hypothetical protein
MKREKMKYYGDKQCHRNGAIKRCTSNDKLGPLGPKPWPYYWEKKQKINHVGGNGGLKYWENLHYLG